MSVVTKQELKNYFKHIEKAHFLYDVYKGKLYFERHQDTYTTQCKNEWLNHQQEFVFHDLKFLLAMFRLEDYPAEELEKM